ncbi:MULTISPECIES: phage portal protein [Sphingobium]|uniref:HK97 family phage portal protein n=1 Tax=Sphingobium yanoikuyae ATCC 51230 TaxID=883163 RepID=K9CW68_SPHYA|nr:MULTISPECIES: phage portal protein [Sphingobium]EKU76469.1 HK97 family phage portal protein [Sphingobium yanoikuyae ATCC 51230]WQE05235.1 phage portal protein [Sphingobium yanoikuyae]SHL78803.1 phage portal protein, HK97 family [Sphingobium sp. YR657]
MKWFGMKAAAGEAGRPVLARAWGSGAVALGEWPASYEAQLRAGVIGNPVAQRAMRLVSEGAGACVLKVGGVDAGMDAGAAARVGALVARASAGQGLIETLASHVLLHGNGYVQVIAGADGMPAELFALRPERVSVEADARGWPAAYLYRVGESVTRLSPEDGAGRTSLLHIRALHPLDDHYGLGCVGAAAGAVAIHNAATVWNKALLDNAARPSGAMVYAPGDGSVLSPEQFERVRREMEAAFSGAANAGRPMLLEGGLDWRAMSLSPAEMDFVGLKAAAAREISLAFGVPPMLMGLPGDNSYANYREANKALWRQTILPLVGKIGAGLAQGLQGWWPGLSLVPDLDAVPALSDERAALWERVAGADFLTAEEKKGLLGIG